MREYVNDGRDMKIRNFDDNKKLNRKLIHDGLKIETHWNRIGK